MIRIGFDARFINDQYHGVGRYAFHLVKAMVIRAPDVQFMLAYHPNLPNTRFPLQPLADEFSNVTLHAVRAPLYLPPEQVLLPLLMRRERLDLWHTPFLSVPLLAPCPIVATIHDLIFFDHPEFVSRRGFLWYYKGSAALSIWRARRVIAVTEATRAEILKRFPQATCKMQVIHEGTGTRFQPRAAAQIPVTRLREKYHLPERFILNVGARRPSKNLGRLVEAFGRIHQQVPHHLVFAGPADRHFEDEALLRTQELGLEDKVHFLGFVDEEDLPYLYNLADLFVFPSLAEGFGLPPAEAMASGVPVVVSDIPALSEVVAEAGPHVNPYDVDALAQEMLAVLTSPEEMARRRGKSLKRAAELSWDAAAEKTLRLYRDVLNRKERAGCFPCVNW